MQYYVRRVKLESLGRLGCLLGWLVALPPALLLAAMLVWLAQRMHQALAQIKPVDLSVFGQPLAHLDLVQLFRLEPLARATATLARDPILTFVAFAAVLVVIGSMVWMVTLLLAGLAYNGMAGLGWGLELELGTRDKPTTER